MRYSIFTNVTKDKRPDLLEHGLVPVDISTANLSQFHWFLNRLTEAEYEVHRVEYQPGKHNTVSLRAWVTP